MSIKHTVRVSLTYEVPTVAPTSEDAQDTLHDAMARLEFLGQHPVYMESEVLSSVPVALNCIPVYVYSNPGLRGCANGGITEQVDTLYLEVQDGHIQLPDEDPRILQLVNREFCGKKYMYTTARNPHVPEGMAGPMFGGNFVFTSDSRFPSAQPIAVHDRYESVEQYCSMFND